MNVPEPSARESLNDCEWMLIAKWEVTAGISYIQWDNNDAHFVFEQHTQLDFFVLTHWNNSLWVDMSLHVHILFWFRVNQSLLFLLNATCLAEKQQIKFVYSLWFDSNPRSTTLYASMLTITPSM